MSVSRPSLMNEFLTPVRLGYDGHQNTGDILVSQDLLTAIPDL